MLVSRLRGAVGSLNDGVIVGVRCLKLIEHQDAPSIVVNIRISTLRPLIAWESGGAKIASED